MYTNSQGDVIDTDWTYAVDSVGLEPKEQKYFEITSKYKTGIESYTVSILDYQ